MRKQSKKEVKQTSRIQKRQTSLFEDILDDITNISKEEKLELVQSAQNRIEDV